MELDAYKNITSLYVKCYSHTYFSIEVSLNPTVVSLLSPCASITITSSGLLSNTSTVIGKVHTPPAMPLTSNSTVDLLLRYIMMKTQVILIQYLMTLEGTKMIWNSNIGLLVSGSSDF